MHAITLRLVMNEEGVHFAFMIFYSTMNLSKLVGSFEAIRMIQNLWCSTALWALVTVEFWELLVSLDFLDFCFLAFWIFCKNSVKKILYIVSRSHSEGNKRNVRWLFIINPNSDPGFPVQDQVLKWLFLEILPWEEAVLLAPRDPPLPKLRLLKL